MKKGEKHKHEVKEAISQKMEGNKNAEQWVIETVMPLLIKFEDLLTNDANLDYITLTDVLLTEKLYPEIWSFWKKKFEKEESVFKSIKRIDSILENRLFSGALKGKYNPTMAIFGLKNNYKWVDKTEQDIKVDAGNGTFKAFLGGDKKENE